VVPPTPMMKAARNTLRAKSSMSAAITTATKEMATRTAAPPPGARQPFVQRPHQRVAPKESRQPEPGHQQDTGNDQLRQQEHRRPHDVAGQPGAEYIHRAQSTREQDQPVGRRGDQFARRSFSLPARHRL
jgi:hypothetical protein